MRSLVVKRRGRAIAEIREIGDGEIETELLETLTPHFIKGLVVPGLSNFFKNLLPEGEIERSLISSLFGFPYTDLGYLSGLQQLEFFRVHGQGLANGIHVAHSYPEILLLDESLSFQAIQHSYSRSGLMRVAGVQPKLCVKGLDGEHYILKHASHELLRAEFYGMKLSRIAGIETAHHYLMSLKDGTQVYLCKRFDLNDKRLIVDGCQLLDIEPSQKYLDQGESYIECSSYESFGAELLNYAKTPLPLIEEYFQRIIFAYLIGNDDLHLKNFSFYIEGGLITGFSPQYDSVMTKVISPNGTKFLAMDLLDGDCAGEFSKTYEKFGFYTRKDFLALGESLGITECEIIIDELIDKMSLMMNEFPPQGDLLSILEGNIQALFSK
ncbi:MAG: HipA domain-containing protein [Planctomycetes bacterium]|nr:HipA domain-containing protein [Planctomycetota bacterium]